MNSIVAGMMGFRRYVEGNYSPLTPFFMLLEIEGDPWDAVFFSELL